MKVNHKTLTSALFALLMFSVAVSGGCGGGGGTPVSQDTITLPDGFSSEYASPDLTLSAPEEISSNDVVVSRDSNAGDDYGDGKKINAFDLLNKTTWRIDSASVKVLDITASDIRTDVYRELKSSNNYNVNTITFLTSGRAMAWAKPDDKKTPIYDALTILFKDSSGAWRNAPLFSAANFIETTDNYIYYAYPKADGKSGIEDSHSVEIAIMPHAALVSQMLNVECGFHYGNIDYRATYDLHRLDNFLILDQTTWEIKDIQVFGMVRGADGSYSYGNPQNYPVTRNDYQNYKITLYTTVVDGRRVLEYRYDNAGATLGGMNKTLTVIFRDNTINQQLIAPFLRFGDGFEFMQKQGNLDVIKGVLKNSDMPGDELLLVSEYGPNANLTIDNSVYYRQNNVDYHYWVRATLAPSF